MLIMRSSLLEVLGEDYILTAKAKGMTDGRILRDHALKNAMLPVVTIIALTLGFTIAGCDPGRNRVLVAGPGQHNLRGGRPARLPDAPGRILLFAVSVVMATWPPICCMRSLDPRVKNA